MTRKILVGLMCIGLALLMSGQVSAGWGSWGSQWSGGSHGSHGSWGSHGSQGSYTTAAYSSAGSHGSYGSYGSSGGSWGSGLFQGRLISRIRAHHARNWASSGGSWGGSSGGSYGSWGGSSGGSYGSWGGSHHSSHGSVGSYASYCAPVYSETGPGTSVYEGEMYEGEVTTEKPVPPPPGDAEEGDSAADLEGPNLDDSALDDATRGLLLVSLPKNAKLFVNGHETSSMGDTRRFVSTGLQSGYRYPYTVQAVIERDGKTVDQTREVKLRAGHSVRLAFDFDQPVETLLTVNVPADAELTLAGSRTMSKGAQRQFTTKQLTEGQVWTGYTIVATLERNGQTLTKEQKIDLRGGESQQITLDFDLNQVAAR